MSRDQVPGEGESDSGGVRGRSCVCVCVCVCVYVYVCVSVCVCVCFGGHYRMSAARPVDLCVRVCAHLCLLRCMLGRYHYEVGRITTSTRSYSREGEKDVEFDTTNPFAHPPRRSELSADFNAVLLRCACACALPNHELPRCVPPSDIARAWATCLVLRASCFALRAVVPFALCNSVTLRPFSLRRAACFMLHASCFLRRASGRRSASRP